ARCVAEPADRNAGYSQLAERAVPLPLTVPLTVHVQAECADRAARDAAWRAESLATIAPALPAPRTGKGKGTVKGTGGAPRAMRDGLLERLILRHQRGGLLDVVAGPEHQGGPVVQARGLQVEDRPATIGGRAARHLGDVGERKRLVEQAQ